MIDTLFGTHIGGWQAVVQFWFWATALFITLLVWYKKGK
jgi:hypothetical protein